MAINRNNYDATLSVGAELDTKQLYNQIANLSSRLPTLKLKTENFGALGSFSRDANEFQRSLQASSARILAFGATASQLYVFGRAFREVIKSTIDVEKQLTDINVVLGLSTQKLGKFSDELFEVANQAGQSFEVASKAALEFSRQGLTVEQTLKRTADALLLTRLSGLDVAKSVETITAALNGFNDATLTSEKLVNKLATVDAAFAVSTADLANAFQRVGSTASDTGVQLDSLIGLVTAAQQTTARGGSVIGNALKTIFQRIQRPEVLDTLREFNVQVEDSQGTVLGADKILQNLAKTYQTADAQQRNFIVGLAAGVFQSNQFRAILSDLAKQNSIYSQAVSISANATDAATRRQEELNKTLSASINELLNNLTKAGSQLGNITLRPAIEQIGKFGKLFSETVSASVSGEGIGGSIGKGVLSGLANYLSGPGIVAIGVLAGRLFQNFAGFAIKSFGSILEATSKQYATTQAINNLLSQQPQIYSAINSGALSDLKIQELILNTLKQQNLEAARRGQIVQSVRGLVKEGQLNISGSNVVLAKPKFEGHVPTKAVGHIPEIQEKIGAYAAGYTPGDVKQTVISNLGRVYYNTAEKIKKFPGMQQPAIIPPQASKAGVSYKKDFMKAHGFNPYANEGYIPNYARFLDPKQKLFNFYKQSIVDDINPEGLKAILNSGGNDNFGSFVVPARRFQKPEQGGYPSVRGGTFYLPRDSKQFYGYSSNRFNYGGDQEILADLVFENPFLIKAGTGGAGPEKAYKSLFGPKALKSLQGDVIKGMGGYVNYAYGYSKDAPLGRIEEFLSKYAPNRRSELSANYIFNNSKQGNQLKYALQELAIGQSFKDIGFDSILSYGYKRKTRSPVLREIFALNQDNYPIASSGFSPYYNKGLIPNYAKFDVNLLKDIINGYGLSGKKLDIKTRNGAQIRTAFSLSEKTGIQAEQLLGDKDFQDEFRKFVPLARGLVPNFAESKFIGPLNLPPIYQIKNVFDRKKGVEEYGSEYYTLGGILNELSSKIGITNKKYEEFGRSITGGNRILPKQLEKYFGQNVEEKFGISKKKILKLLAKTGGIYTGIHDKELKSELSGINLYGSFSLETSQRRIKEQLESSKKLSQIKAIYPELNIDDRITRGYLRGYITDIRKNLENSYPTDAFYSAYSLFGHIAPSKTRKVNLLRGNIFTDEPLSPIEVFRTNFDKKEFDKKRKQILEVLGLGGDLSRYTTVTGDKSRNINLQRNLSEYVKNARQLLPRDFSSGDSLTTRGEIRQKIAKNLKAFKRDEEFIDLLGGIKSGNETPTKYSIINEGREARDFTSSFGTALLTSGEKLFDKTKRKEFHSYDYRALQNILSTSANPEVAFRNLPKILEATYRNLNIKNMGEGVKGIDLSKVTPKEIARLARITLKTLDSDLFKPAAPYVSESSKSLEAFKKFRKFKRTTIETSLGRGQRNPTKYNIFDSEITPLQAFEIARRRLLPQNLEIFKDLEKLYSSSIRDAEIVFRGQSPIELAILDRLGMVTSPGTRTDEKKFGQYISSSVLKTAGYAISSPFAGKPGAIGVYRKEGLGELNYDVPDNEKYNSARVSRISKKALLGVLDIERGRVLKLQEYLKQFGKGGIDLPEEVLAFNRELNSRDLKSLLGTKSQDLPIIPGNQGLIDLYRKIKSGRITPNQRGFRGPSTSVDDLEQFEKFTSKDFISYLKESLGSTQPGIIPFGRDTSSVFDLRSFRPVSRNFRKAIDSGEIDITRFHEVIYNKKVPASSLVTPDKLEEIVSLPQNVKRRLFNKGIVFDLPSFRKGSQIGDYYSEEKEYPFFTTRKKEEIANIGSLFAVSRQGNQRYQFKNSNPKNDDDFIYNGLVPNFNILSSLGGFGAKLLPKQNLPANIPDAELEKIYQQYATAFYDPSKNKEPIGLNLFTNKAFNSSYVEKKGNYIFGQHDGKVFLPTHFAPKSKLGGLSTIKDLKEYDNVVFAVTQDLSKLLQKTGFGVLKSNVPVSFRGGEAIKDILASNIIRTPLLASSMFSALMSGNAKSYLEEHGGRIDKDPRQIYFGEQGRGYNAVNYMKQKGLIKSNGLVPNYASLLEEMKSRLAGRKLGINRRFQTTASHAIKDSFGRHLDESGLNEIGEFFRNPVFDPNRIIRVEPSRNKTPGEVEVEYIVPSKVGQGIVGQRLKIALNPDQLENSRLINILPRHGVSAAGGMIPNYARLLGSGVEGSFYDLEKKYKGFPLGFKKLHYEYLNQTNENEFKIGKHLSKNSGLIPNFNALTQAIVRENQAGVPKSLIKVGKSPILKSNLNPAGLGVYNLRDEPQGLHQGISRALSEGKNPKSYGVPNFAPQYEANIPSSFNDPFNRPAGTKILAGDELKKLEDSIKKYQQQFRLGIRKQEELGKALDGLEGEFNLTKGTLNKIRTTRFLPILRGKNPPQGLTRTQLSGTLSNTDPNQLLFGAFSGGNQGEFVGIGQQAAIEQRNISAKQQTTQFLRTGQNNPDLLRIMRQGARPNLDILKSRESYSSLVSHGETTDQLKIRKASEKIQELEKRASRFGGLGSLFGQGKKDFQALQRDNPNSAIQITQGLQNKAFLASIVGPILGGVLQQSFGDKTTTARGLGQTAAGLGNVIGFAATGAALGGGLPGAIAGGVIGGLSELPNILKAFSDTLPDLQRRLGELQDISQKTSSSLAEYIDSSEKLNEIYSGNISGLTKGQVQQIEQVQRNSLLSIPNLNDRNRVEGLINNRKFVEARTEISRINQLNNQGEAATRLGISVKNLLPTIKTRKSIEKTAALNFPVISPLSRFTEEFSISPSQLKTIDANRKKFVEESLKDPKRLKQIESIASEIEQQALGLTQRDTGKTFFDLIKDNESLSTKLSNAKPENIGNVFSDIALSLGGFNIEAISEISNVFKEFSKTLGPEAAQRFQETFSIINLKKISESGKQFAVNSEKSSKALISLNNLLLESQNQFEKLGLSIQNAGIKKLGELTSNLKIGEIRGSASNQIQLLRRGGEGLKSFFDFQENESGILNRTSFAREQLRSDTSNQVTGNIDDTRKNIAESLATSLNEGLLKDQPELIKKRIDSLIGNFDSAFKPFYDRLEQGEPITSQFLDSLLKTTKIQLELAEEVKKTSPTAAKLFIENLTKLSQDISGTSKSFKINRLKINTEESANLKINREQFNQNVRLLGEKRAVNLENLRTIGNIDVSQIARQADLSRAASGQGFQRKIELSNQAEFESGVSNLVRQGINNPAFQGLLNNREISNVNDLNDLISNQTERVNSLQEIGVLTEDQTRELETQKDTLSALKDLQQNIINLNNIRLENVKQQTIEEEKLLRFAAARIAEQRRINEENSREGKFNEVTKNLGNTFFEQFSFTSNDYFSELSRHVEDFGQEFKGAFKNGFAEMAVGAKTASDAFRDIGINISNAILTKASNLATDTLFGSLFGNQSVGGGTGLLSGLFNKKSSGGTILPRKYARGGFVDMGSGLRDDVPALLSGGEFVIKKSSTKKLGKSTLDILNETPEKAKDIIKYSSNKEVNALFANEYFGFGSKIRPKKGELNVSPVLSDLALTDENNPQNALRFSREKYFFDLREYQKQIKKAEKEFDKRKRTSLYSAYISAGINFAGGAFALSRSVNPNNPITTQNPTTNIGRSGGFDFNGFNNRYGNVAAMGGLITRKYNFGGNVFGGDTSKDNIPALIMGGEFVVNKSSANKIGLNKLNYMNRMGELPRFADGGRVGNDYISNIGTKNNNVVSTSPLININNEITVTFNDNGTVSTNVQSSNNNQGEDRNSKQDQGRQIGEMIKGMFNEMVVKESKPGGKLYERFQTK